MTAKTSLTDKDRQVFLSESVGFIRSEKFQVVIGSCWVRNANG